MNNKSVSDFVAAAMDAALKSSEYKSMFRTQYKTAADENDLKGSSDSQCVSDDNDAKNSASSDSACADDDNDASTDEGNSDCSYSDDAPDQIVSAYDVAIEGLLTASAALDTLGMDHTSTLSLKLASLVVNAKKAVKKPAKKSDKSTAKKDDKSTAKSTSKSTSTKPTSKSTATKPASKSTSTSKSVSKTTKK